MIAIPGHDDISELIKKNHYTLYSGRNDRLSRPVHLKHFPPGSYLFLDYNSLAVEFQQLKRIQSESVVEFIDIIPPNEDAQTGLVIIHEAVSGVSLKQLKKNNHIDMMLFLDLAIQLSNAIAALHQAGLFAKEIIPKQIVVDPANNKLKITHLGFRSLVLSYENDFHSPMMVNDVLPYISPELTGRVRGHADYRSDFYVLGTILYDLLVGNPPFVSDNPMVIVHGHIAQKPAQPKTIRKEIPSAISDLIMKLLAKNPEDRYQSAFSLQIHLQNCLLEYRHRKSIIPLPLGRYEVPDAFSLPEKFYGRKIELETLLSAFQKVRQGDSQILLLDGYPGIGKTRLIWEFNKAIADTNACFISGKYDSFFQNIPYYAIIQALQKLIRQVLLMDVEEIGRWRKKILSALEPNAQLMIDMIPEIERIIGKQPPLPELTPDETLHRFQMTCATFATMLATKDQPLILFLDDLQWADSASLQLIEKLITEFDQQYFLFLGAYRNNEVHDHHPLKRVIESLENKKAQTCKIHIDALPYSETQHIVADTFFIKSERIQDLAEAIFSKTHGNPFFILQYLQSLHSDNILSYDVKTGRWQWDLDRIRFTGCSMTENAVNLILHRARRLSPSAQNILELVACFGNRIDLDLLSAICRNKISEVATDVMAAFEAGFIHQTDQAEHQLFHASTTGIEKEHAAESPFEIEFVHDTFRQVVYSMIPDERRREHHLCIGRTLYKEGNNRQQGARLVEMVTHFNLSIPLLSKASEKKQIAELNLLAGRQAIKLNAYATARIYFETGTALLPPDAWSTDFELTASLQKERAACEYLCGNFMAAEALFQQTIPKMRTPIEKADLYNKMIVLYTSMNKLNAAIHLGIQGARMLGVRLSPRPHLFTLGWEYLKFRIRLGIKTIISLLHMPAMSDKKQIAIEHLLTSLSMAAQYNNPSLYLLIVIMQINAYLKYGNSVFSPIGYAALGGMMAARLNAYSTAYAYGNLALMLSEKVNNQKVSCSTEFIFAWCIQHWQKSISENIAYYEEAYTHALKTGNLIVCGHSVNMRFMTKFLIGEPLQKVFSEYVKQEPFLRKINDPFIYESFRSNIRLFLQFLGPMEEFRHFCHESERVDIRPMMSGKGINKLYLFNGLINKLIGHFIYGNYTECLHCIQQAERVAPIAKGTLQYVVYCFFLSLTLLTLFPDAVGDTKKSYRRQLRANQRKLKRYAKACPENFLPFYCLVTAEKARIENRFERSIPLYRKAIRLFKERGYIHFEALANEMTMRAHSHMGFVEMSRIYFTEAYSLYLKWGASAKVADLEEKNSALINENAEQKRTSLLPLLDNDTVVQTLRSISTEIRLSDLLTKLMKISVINAGAEKGYFISKKADAFFVEAYHCPANENPVIITSRPLVEHDDLLHAAIHVVDKTMKPLVLENASQSETHRSNAYILKNNVKSVLCLPVIRKTVLVGIMYFENNAIAGAFTAKHTEILQMVASQAAISFENATLYEHLIEKEQELQDLSGKLRSLSAELVLAEEKERRRIAIELHDRIGQALTASRIKIGNLQHTATSSHVFQELDEISTLIKQSIRDTRSLTFELSPHALYELGLEAALEHLAEQTREQYGLWVEFEDDNQSKQIDESTRVLMYQATRELLFNVVKHGRAKKAKLSITREDENIRIEVADNGIGFNPNDLQTDIRQPKGFGIFSIKERLHHQGGHFQISSVPGQGTRAILRSPMRYANKENGGRHYERKHTADR